MCALRSLIDGEKIQQRLILMRYFQWKVEFFERVWNPGNCETWVMERDERGSYRVSVKRSVTAIRACAGVRVRPVSLALLGVSPQQLGVFLHRGCTL